MPVKFWIIALHWFLYEKSQWNSSMKGEYADKSCRISSYENTLLSVIAWIYQKKVWYTNR